MRELTHERTAYSKRFELPDGRILQRCYSAPVHSQERSGAWIAIEHQVPGAVERSLADKLPGGLARATRTTYDAGVGEGEIYSADAVYATARSTSDACDSYEMPVGQTFSLGAYWCLRSFIGIDTSAIDDNADIESATLYMAIQNDYSTTDFDLSVYRFAWAAPLCDNREANFDGAYGSGVDEGVWRNTSGLATDTYYSMAVDPAGVTKTGSTKYALVSDEDVNGSAPTNNEYVMIRRYNSAYPAYLDIVLFVKTPNQLRGVW